MRSQKQRFPLLTVNYYFLLKIKYNLSSADNQIKNQ